jgi:hypothetical protein
MKTSELYPFLEDSQTLFVEDSLASPIQAPLAGETKALMMTVGSGQKCLGLFSNVGPLGLLVKTLLASTVWRSRKWFLTWKPAATKSKRLKFRLVPSDTIIGGRASGFLATPTATANQSAPSMQKHPGCRGVDLTPEILEKRMGFPIGWTDLEKDPLETQSFQKSLKSSDGQF